MTLRRVGLTSRVAANELLMCKACLTRNRAGTSAFCPRCASRYNAHGDPKGGKVIHKDAYKGERKTITDFLHRWRVSPQILAALKILGVWMSSAASWTPDRPPVPGKKLLACFSDQGVAPRKLFIELFSGWLYIRRNPSATVNVIFSLYQFIRRAGYQRRGLESLTPSRIEREEIGRFAHSTFAPLLLNIEQALERAEADRNERISILSKPFDAEELRKSNRSRWRLLKLDRPLDWTDGRLKGGSGPAKRKAMKLPILTNKKST